MQGVVRAVQIFGTAVGPLIVGAVRDAGGAEALTQLLWTIMPAMLTIALLTFPIPMPRKSKIQIQDDDEPAAKDTKELERLPNETGEVVEVVEED